MAYPEIKEQFKQAGAYIDKMVSTAKVIEKSKKDNGVLLKSLSDQSENLKSKITEFDNYITKYLKKPYFQDGQISPSKYNLLFISIVISMTLLIGGISVSLLLSDILKLENCILRVIARVGMVLVSCFAISLNILVTLMFFFGLAVASGSHYTEQASKNPKGYFSSNPSIQKVVEVCIQETGDGHLAKAFSLPFNVDNFTKQIEDVRGQIDTIITESSTKLTASKEKVNDFYSNYTNLVTNKDDREWIEYKLAAAPVVRNNLNSLMSSECPFGIQDSFVLNKVNCSSGFTVASTDQDVRSGRFCISPNTWGSKQTSQDWNGQCTGVQKVRLWPEYQGLQKCVDDKQQKIGGSPSVLKTDLVDPTNSLVAAGLKMRDEELMDAKNTLDQVLATFPLKNYTSIDEILNCQIMRTEMLIVQNTLFYNYSTKFIYQSQIFAIFTVGLYFYSILLCCTEKMKLQALQASKSPQYYDTQAMQQHLL